MNAVAKVLLLSLVVETLHSVLDFVQGLLLSVESFDADKIESVGHEVRLDRHVQWGVTGHRRTQVDLQEPRLEIRVDQDIKPHDLEAIGSMGPILLHGILHVILAAQERLDDNIISSRPQEIHVYTNLLEMPTESTQ